MSDQFISAVTNEAMSRICYTGGWDLKPYKFLVSQSDVFDGTSTQPAWDKKDIWDSGSDEVREQLKGEASKYLQKIVTQDMQDDYTAGNAWFNARFSSITKTNETTLAHHLNIPGDIAIDTSSKNIKSMKISILRCQTSHKIFSIYQCMGSKILASFPSNILILIDFNKSIKNKV